MLKHWLNYCCALLLFVPCSYLCADSDSPKSITDGWIIETPQRNKVNELPFLSFPFQIVDDINAYLNPANVINNTPNQIDFEHIFYQNGQIKTINNESYWFTDNIVKYCFKSDSLWNDVVEKYDNYHRIIEITKKLRSTDEIYFHRNFIYNDAEQMLYLYENDNLTFVLTEYKEPGKKIYTQFNKNGKRSSYIISYDLENRITKIEYIMRLPRSNDISIIICKYNNDKIIYLRRYNGGNNRIIKDINFFYDGEKIVKIFDSISNICEEYDNYDLFNNWQTKIYTVNGSLQSVSHRQIHYNTNTLKGAQR
jgi:hypothetical protein